MEMAIISIWTVLQLDNTVLLKLLLSPQGSYYQYTLVLSEFKKMRKFKNNKNWHKLISEINQIHIHIFIHDKETSAAS